MLDAVRRLVAPRLAADWLTPLAADPVFRPQTAALIAIQPFIDDLADGSSIAAVISHRLVAGTKESRVTDIVDAHHHIWRQADLPWLSGPMQPRIFGPYEPIRRDYPIREYLADIAGSGVTRSVYVQANWAPSASRRGRLGAADRRRARLAACHRRLCRFRVDDVRPQLDRLARLSAGARHPHAAALARKPDVPLRGAARPRADPVIRRNVARLADYGWTFDLQVFAPQMEDAAGLADACPDVTFVLQHAGMLEDLSDEGRAAWRDGMRGSPPARTSSRKLSGLGTFIHRNDPGAHRR